MADRTVDILAFGAHPDDVELGCGGTLIQHARRGHATAVVDLTRGELGTRGTPAIRDAESEKARTILGARFRENLRMADGFFRNDRDHQLQVIRAIRTYRPRIVLANAVDDRHPDHGRAARLVRDACFLAGLRKIETMADGGSQAPHRPDAVYHYIQAYHIEPDLVVDVSEAFDDKMRAVAAHASQFHDPASDEPETFISSAGFLDFVGARNRDWGTLIGATHAEGFTTHRFIGVDDLTTLR